MKNIFKINYDGMYSSIEEVLAIDDWTDNIIKFDDYQYFPTKAKAKKQLLKELTDRMNHLKEAIKHIKNTY
jgi:hypothetical protein